jgi:hypothetical protein
MHSLTSGPAKMHGMLRSAMLLAACLLAAALLLAPIAISRTGSSGPSGLLVAAGICLFSGLLGEAAGRAVAQNSPVGAALVGMMVRMFAPLAVCVALLAIGQSGRTHVYFIGYLITFYMVTLGLETWLAVKRASVVAPKLDRSAR